MAINDAIVQVVIVGCIAFTCPGFFNALTGLGGAGGANPTAGNWANTALYACFAVVGYFGGAMYSVFGNRILMCAGGLTYALYAAGIYIVGTVDGTLWLAPVVGAILGVGAASFWTAQGAMMMAYATPETKGMYIAVFWAIFNLGGTVGGLIQFGLNFNTERPGLGEEEGGNSANPASYFTFIAVMCVGSVAAFFFLVNPTKVKKADNSAVTFEKRPVLEEMMGALKVITHPVMLILTVTFVASNWYYTYQLNYLNAFLFTIRSRGLNSALYWATQMLAAYITGKILDWPGMKKKKRCLNCYIFMVSSLLVHYILAFCTQYNFEGGYDKGKAPYKIDLVDSQRTALPVFALLVGAVGDTALQTFSYWLMGAIAGNDSNLSARFSGYYKGVQSAGAAVAWALDISDSVSYATQLIICFVLFVLSSATSIMAVRLVKEDEPVEDRPTAHAAVVDDANDDSYQANV
jgi:MFS family permease